MHRLVAFLCLGLGAETLIAEDGKLLYETYCGACHGPDGKGVSGGQFPPLAGSDWVAGTPKRMVQVVLHGLQGEISVTDHEGNERGYNLVMPPQGAALRDEQIAAIVTYVRSSWGNEGESVTPEMVAKEREATAKRTEMWNPAEILRRHPLDEGGPGKHGIQHIIAHVYHGEYKTLAEFRKATAVSVEEEQGNVISLRHAGDRYDHFGIVWEGTITAPRAGDFKFFLDSDDGSAVFVGGQKVVEVDGTGSMGRGRQGSLFLEKGEHPIRIEYFEYQGGEEITLSWRGPGVKETFLSEGKKKRSNRPSHPSIPLLAKDEARIYRNFIEGSTSRGIGVGFPEGVNVVFSADSMALESVWKGDFLDAGRHWTNRGQGWTKPRGPAIKLSKGPAFAVLSQREETWPDTYQEGVEVRFRGYRLNEKRAPTFFYTISQLEVTDSLAAHNGGTMAGLVRRIEIEAPENPSQNIYFRVATGLPLEKVCKQGFRVGESLLVQVHSQTAGEAVTRGTDLLVPLRLHPGKNILTLNYTFE